MEKKYEEVEAKIGGELQETEAVQGVSFDSIPSGTIQLGDGGVFTGGNVTVKGVVKEQPISFEEIGEGTTDEEIAKALDEAAKTAEPTPEETHESTQPSKETEETTPTTSEEKEADNTTETTESTVEKDGDPTEETQGQQVGVDRVCRRQIFPIIKSRSSHNLNHFTPN